MLTEELDINTVVRYTWQDPAASLCRVLVAYQKDFPLSKAVNWLVSIKEGLGK